MIQRSLVTLFVLLLSSSTKTKAQHAYIPIQEDSVLWITVREDWHEGEPGPPPHTFDYLIAMLEGKDTLFNGKRYLRLLWKYPSFGLPLPVGYNYTGEWIRQDTVAKKVWYMRNKVFPYSEEVLYDFSLQVGDTITDTLNGYFSPNRLYPYKAWVDNIDSVYWTDGRWHNRWFINSDYGPAWFSPPAQAVQIEGMGYTTDFLDDPLLRYHPLVATTLQVVCFRANGQWLYEQPNPWNADCDSMLVKNVLGINDITADLEKPLLYPNPVNRNGALHLNNYLGNNKDRYRLSVYEADGKEILSIPASPGMIVDLSRYNIHQGLHLVRLTDTKGQTVLQEKIIVQ
jgi:hypothetical protein